MPHTGEICEQVTEKNYIFRVTDELKQKIQNWATDDDTPNKKSRVVPEVIQNKFLDDLARHSSEISISRPYERLQWGIRVPNDES